MCDMCYDPDDFSYDEDDDDDDELEPLDLSTNEHLDRLRAYEDRMRFIALLTQGDVAAIDHVTKFFEDQIPKYAEFRLVFSERYGPFFKYEIKHEMQSDDVNLTITYESGLTGRTLDSSKYTVASVDENTLNILSNEDLRGMKVSVTRG